MSDSFITVSYQGIRHMLSPKNITGTAAIAGGLTTIPANTVRHAVFAAALAMPLAVLVPGAGAKAQQAAGPTANAAPGGTILITDGSRTMWGRLRGSPKVSLARNAMKQVLPEFDNRLTIGLMAFGHRDRRSCSDVELLSPVKKLNAARFLKAFNSVNPRGRAPLTSAIERAARILDHRNNKSTIILLSDGFENCRPDTCRLARRLEREGRDLTIHVIALGMKPRDRRNISCITNATNGKLISVGSSAALNRALSELFKRAATRPVKVAIAPPVRRPNFDPNAPPELLLTAILAAKGPVLSTGLEWRIRPKSAAGTDEKDVYLGKDPQPRLKLAPGEYIVEARLEGVKAGKTVTIAKTGQTRATINLNAGRVKLQAFADRGGQALKNVFYTIYRKSEKPVGTSGPANEVVAITSTPEPEYTLKSGSYIITVQHGGTRSERVVNVAPGKTGNIDIIMYSGELVLDAINQRTGKAIDGAYYFIYEDAPLASGGRREIARSAALKPDFRLPAGTYHIRVKWGQAEQLLRATVRAGKRKTLTIPMNTASMSLTARIRGDAAGENQPVKYEILREPDDGGTPRQIAQTSRENPTFNLDAGNYIIIAKFGSANARTRTRVGLSPGQSVSLTLDIPAAIMTMEFRPEGSERPSRDVFWTIATPEGGTIWTTGNPAPRTPISPGTYMVIAEHRGKLYRRTINMRSGETKRVTVSTN